MNIVITGASSGIGLRTAEKLKDLGNNVVNVALEPCGVAGVVDILADFSEPSAARRAAQEAFERLHTQRFERFPEPWRQRLAKAQSHGDVVTQTIEETKLKTVAQLWRLFEETEAEA